MRSLSEAKEVLTRLYGFEFPDSLFLLHEFLASLSAEEWEHYSLALGMEPIGPLQVLSIPEAKLQRLKPTVPLVLHWRFYGDLPEFFSCLKGDQDWLHWGLLLDEPAKGFRGAASYYANDLETMRVYPSLFAVVLKRIEERTTSWEPVDTGEKADHNEQQNHLRRFAEKIRHFIEDCQIPLDDGRGTGQTSDTGLDLLVDAKGQDWVSSILGDWSVFPPSGHPHIIHLGKMKEEKEIKRLVAKAIAASEQGRPLPALSLGRSLWYWKDRRGLANSGNDYAAVAFDLLKRAYTLLDRRALLRVLDMHFEHRDRDSVDVLRSYRIQGVTEQER